MLDIQKLKTHTKGIIFNLYSQCDIFKVYINEENVVIIEIKGGLNGRGEWEKYFIDLYVITSALKCFYKNVWLVDLNVDVLDDVWYASFGIR